MILVTGATGHLGKATIDFLLQKNPGIQLSALVRDKEKATDLAAKGIEMREGDYSDYASLVKAFQGIEKLFFVSSNDVANRHLHQPNVVKAAQAAGVKHVVYTSFQNKTDDGSSPLAFLAGPHLETEKLLKESGLFYTILKNAIYAEMLPVFAGENIAETGTIFIPAEKGKASYATRTDMAEASANVLTGVGHENKTYQFATADSVSFDDVAMVLTDILGKHIVYANPSVETYTSELTKAGVPAEGIGFFAAFAQATAQGEFDFPDTDLEKLLGRKPTTVKEYLQSVYSTVNS